MRLILALMFALWSKMDTLSFLALLMIVWRLSDTEKT